MKWSMKDTVGVAMMMSLVVGGAAFGESSLERSSASVTVYPVPEARLLSPMYTVRVRARDEARWMEVPVYTVRIGFREMKNSAFVIFDMAKPVVVEVTKREEGAGEAVELRPRGAARLVSTSGNVAQLELQKPGVVSVEYDGKRMENLQIFAGAPEKNLPSSEDPNVIWFGPGVHRFGTHPAISSNGETSDGLPRSVIRVKSGQTVYVAGGAVVEAGIRVENGARDVTIRGRGILDLSSWNLPGGRSRSGSYHVTGITLQNSSTVVIDGITIKQPTGYAIFGGQVDHVTIRNLKAMSSHLWADGIDMMSSSDITISNAFVRTADDCIAVYGSRFACRGDSRRWLVSDSILWADNAHPIYLGVHGDYEGEGDTIADITFRNIDILESEERNPAFLGAMSIGCGDRNVCRDITFEDIRVDRVRTPGGRLIDLQFKFFEPSTVAGKAIQNIVFRNVVYPGEAPSFIAGKSETQWIEDVTFENVSIAGRIIQSPEDGHITVGEYVKGVKFR